MDEETIKQLLLTYMKVDECLNKILSRLDEYKIKHDYETRKLLLQLGKEMDLTLAKAYNLDIDDNEKSILNIYHDQTQMMMKLIINQGPLR